MSSAVPWGVTAYGKALTVLCVIVLAVLAATAHTASASSADAIYRRGDWLRYGYTIRTSNETCVWVVRVTIREVNATHVRYDAGLEGMVSGGRLCEGFTTLLALGLGFESANPVDLRVATPESRRVLINPNYTGTYSLGNSTVRYYRGVLVWYYEVATTPFVGTTEIEVIDTSIDALKPLVAAAAPTPTRTPSAVTITVTETLTAVTRTTVTSAATIERSTTYTATVYQKDWGTAVGLAVALFVVGVVTGVLALRK